MQKMNVEMDTFAYINVMESVVAQRVEQQLQHLPDKIRRYIRLEEVVTHALNRLPALYASSERGWNFQLQCAECDMDHDISEAVRQALLAVQVDPIRLSQPLHVGQSRAAEAVLHRLRSLFQDPTLDWHRALEKLNNQGLDAESETTTSTQPTVANCQSRNVWLPDIYGGEMPRIRRYE